MINSFRGKYFFLLNFYEAPVEYKGLTYQNNEAAFQAQKCIDEKDKQDFVNLSSSQAKHLGRKIQLRKDWENIKIGEMRAIVHAKFSQHPELAEQLLETGEEHLEEGNTWGDRTWGTVNGKGANHLGKILMQERDALKNA